MRNGQLDGDDLVARLTEILSDDSCLFVFVTANPVGYNAAGEPLADYAVFRNGCAHETMALLNEGKACLVDEARSEHRCN